MRNLTVLCVLLAGIAAGCNSGGKTTDPVEPVFSAALFSASSSTVDHPYFPLRPGTVWTYQVETEDGVETVVVEVLEATRVVAGVTCAVVRDRVYLDELLIEDTHDWYAQDDAGNVWYLGEEVDNHEYDDEGNLVATDHEGAWETGLDVAGVGAVAVAGIVMKASLVVGDTYGQEFYPGEAEDMAEIVGLDVLVTLDDGSIHRCLKTRDWNPLEPDSTEFKYYAAGLGLVAEENEDGSERLELEGTFFLGDGSLPDFAAATFSDPSRITNPYLAFGPGATFEYESDTEDGLETIVVEVLATTRVVNGVECAVVRDRVFLDGLLVEDTHDWFAQDDAGNVWYLGESVENFEYDEDGNLIGTDDEGAWEAGVDGAEPGVVMWAVPVAGEPYRQEFYEEEAEDMAVVVSLDATVELAGGTTYPGCLQTLEWTPLEPFALEYKFHAPGVGLVLEVDLASGDRVERTGP